MIRISGIVRLPDDLDSDIDAVFQIVNDRLRLTTGRTELGSWPLTDVEVRRLSTHAFRLDISGEAIHFLPANPDLFASLQFVDEAVDSGEPKKRPKRSRRFARSIAEKPQPSIEEVPAERPEPPADQPERREPEPAPFPSVGDTPEPETIEVDLTEEQIVSSGRHRRLLSRTRYLGAATRDQLRQTGIWPLDRLKALSTEDSLPTEHTHTYQAVTTQAGIVRRVCTECGHVSFMPIDQEQTGE
jgi:hypothetical protein